MNKFFERASELYEETRQLRRELHQFPEVGLELNKTAEFVCNTLKKYDIEPNIICKGGIVANIGKKDGKTILLRADMDALPMDEINDLDFKSKHKGIAHTCGHDLHTAMLLTAAKILKENEHLLEGNVKLMFQPDEEGLTGAKLMLKKGLLENPKVDCGLAMHVFPAIAKSGNVVYNKGVYSAGATRFKINIYGKGGHGAAPEATVDPLFICMQIYQSLLVIQTREVSGREPFVLTIGKLGGGDAPNIIPHTATIEGSIRFFDSEIGDHAIRRITEIAESTARLFRGNAAVEVLGTCPPIINDDELTEDMIGILKEELGPERIIESKDPLMGSEDFAFIMNEIPGLYLSLGAGASENERMTHDPEVIFDESCLPYGVSTYVSCAVNWLKTRK